MELTKENECSQNRNRRILPILISPFLPCVYVYGVLLFFVLFCFVSFYVFFCFSWMLIILNWSVQNIILNHNLLLYLCDFYLAS